MREFEYFLFENFDADEESGNPKNPRNFLGKQTDGILSQVAESAACIGNPVEIDRLVKGGILRKVREELFFDCPVFLREDAEVLHRAVQDRAAALTDLFEPSLPKIKACCTEIRNGFSVDRNLYHILCGMVFDGFFFDYLTAKGALATSRQHPTGLDYLTVIYEKCAQLQTFSDGLLCSYNRLVNAHCSLQSFGDAQGDRFDFYRLFRLMEKGGLSGRFREAGELLESCFGGVNKNMLLSEVVSFLKTGKCTSEVMRLLELFGYAQNGTICVPIFTPENKAAIAEIEHIVEESVGEAMVNILHELAEEIDITAVRHGVKQMEIANELYHILFGMMNGELVARGIAAAPPNIPGEGRYDKCMELYV